MIENVKPIDTLSVADIEKNSVWQYVSSRNTGEVCVKPVKKVPVASPSGKVIGAQVCFASGAKAWALIGNIDTENPSLMEHFITLSIERDGVWFQLARYHDHDFSERGPDALAQFLNMKVDSIFPIIVDVREYLRGNPAVLVFEVLKEPKNKLSREEIIAMAVP